MPHSYILAARAALLLRRALAGYGLLLALLLAGTAHAQAPTFAAAASLHPEGIYGTSSGRATATDAAGNQYVTGFYSGTIMLGSTTLKSASSGNSAFVAKRSASTGAWLWAVSVGGSNISSNANGYGIAIDGSGNALVTGSFYATVTFATSTAAISLTSAGGKDIFVAKFGGSDGACAWAVQAGGTNDDTGAGIAVDGSGNALVTGNFYGTANFGTSSLVATGNNNYTSDVFVAKLGGSDGTCAWAVRAGGTNSDGGNSIAIDGSGNALVTGSFSGTASFGTVNLVSSLGYSDIFVAKFGGADGACTWAVQAGGSSVNSYDSGTSIAVDGSGNALVTGLFYGTASFGTSPTATSLVAAGPSGSSGGSSDVFVAKFGGADGTCAWAVRAGGTSGDISFGIAVDGSGNALVTGSFASTASFGTSPAATNLTAVNVNSDVFVAKFEPVAGTCAWAVRAGGSGSDAGYGIAVDGSGNPLVTGQFQATASFATTADANTIPSYPGGIVRGIGTGMFAVRLAGSTGAWQTPAQANSGGTSTGRATATDAAGNQYITGEFSGNIVLGSTTLVSAGVSDVFVAKRSASGVWLWAVRAGGSDIDAGYSIAVDGSGNALVTGGFRGTASFGTSPTATSLASTNGIYSDVFVAKFGAADGVCAWALRVGASNTGADAAGYGVAVDGSGNVLVTGCVLGTVTFATTPIATTLVANVYNKTLFVAKFAGANGTCIWAVKTGGVTTVVGTGIAIDGSGNALVTGSFTGTASFGTSPTGTSLVSASNNYSDVFVAKFGAADGTCAWAVRAGGTNSDAGNGIAVDGSGNALVTGSFQGTASFGSSSLVAPGSNGYNINAFVAKFGGADGTCAWAVQAGSSTTNNNTSVDAGNAIAVDGSGNALVTGEFRETASFGTSPTATNLVALGSSSYNADVFVAKFGGADGTCAWAVQAGGPSSDAGYGVAIDGSGKVLITGNFQGTAVFGSTTLVGAGALGGGFDPSGFVATLTVPAAPTLTSLSPGNGPVGSTLTLNGTNLTGATAITFAGTGNNTVTTGFTVNAAGTQLTGVVVPAGATTGLVTVTTPSGTTNGQTFTVSYPSLVVSAAGQAIAAGTYSSITIQSGGEATLQGATIVNTAVTVQPGGTLNTNCQPLSGTASFTLADGATLTICDPSGIDASGATGAVQVSGARSFSPDATYSYAGTGPQSTGPGLPARVRNLTLANASTVRLTAPSSVAQVLTLGDGNFDLNGQTLTLLSSSTGTALVVNSGAGVVQGTGFTVQRYIDPTLNAGAGYRHYSAPVSNTTLADLATSGYTPEISQAATYNSSATPGTTRPFPTLFAYDQSRLVTVTNNYGAFDKGFVAPTSLSAPMSVGKGYVVQIGAAALVDFVGTPTTGDQASLALARNADGSPDAAKAGWQLVGNPYPSPLDWSLVASGDRPNLDGAMYVIQSSGPYTGSYRTYVNGLSTTGVNNPLIASSQGFWVRVSAGQTSGSLTFRNAQRVTSYASQQAFQRTTSDPRPALRLELAGAGLADGWVTYASTGATASFDSQYDAAKLFNATGLNLSSVTTTDNLAIDGQAAFTAATVLPLTVGVPAAGTYTLTAAALSNLPGGLTPYLRDAATGQTVALAVGSTYSFSVSAAQAQAPLLGRFTLQFSSTAPLATAPAALAAQVLLYPNPAHGSFAVMLPGMTGASTVQAELFNALGQVVHQKRYALSASGTTLTVTTTGLAAGMYTLRLVAGATTVTKRVALD
jgi:hypothetical protein